MAEDEDDLEVILEATAEADKNKKKSKLFWSSKKSDI